MDIPMNKEQYATFWETESKNFDSCGIYQKLTDLLPDGKVLEIGCGNGIGTHYLSQKHEILSLDHNQYLIDKATNYLNKHNNTYQIHKCDLFQLTDEDKKIIQDFKPNIIVGWFIGAGGESVNKHIKQNNHLGEKVKLYREKIEDIIVSNDILVDSVQIINFAIRGALDSSVSKKVLFDTQKQDYDTYVFGDVGFEVYDVNIIDWNREQSNFTYAYAVNPNISKNAQLIPSIISLSAKQQSDI